MLMGKTILPLLGKGLLDGQASNEKWWPWKGSKRFGWEKGMPSQLDENNRPLLKKYNDTQTPLEERQMGEGHCLRPPFINFSHCNTVKIEDITLNQLPILGDAPIVVRKYYYQEGNSECHRPQQ